MKPLSQYTRWSVMLGLLLSFVSVSSALAQQTTGKVSRLGEYDGYSTPAYDGWARSSQYVKARDGTRLAVDIIRPTRNGVLHSTPLPVIWTHHRYVRASVVGDSVVSILDWPYTTWLKEVLLHGYIVSAVDTRGGGASFGTQQGFFAREEARDAYDVTEWLAAQPWSSGNIGMYGRSYLAITQYFAASERPPHLKAIFPEMASFDWYPFIFPGGIYRSEFISAWNFGTKTADRGAPVAPVDADTDGRMVREAQRVHVGNRDMVEIFAPLAFRNSVDLLTKEMTHLERSPWTYSDGIENSKVAIYNMAGWFDAFPRDQLLWFNNLSNPQKMVIGPWFHTEWEPLDLAAEHLRWYDYWLKDVDNGIMDEAPIHYWVMGAPAGEEWRSAWEWPLPEEQRTNFYFAEGRTGTVASANDGALGRAEPNARDGYDEYVVDYSATMGLANRWINTHGGPAGYPDLTENDTKGLTYTSPPLEADVEVTGHPVVHLWVTATASDADFFVYLEEIDAAGRSNYVTEGVLRASHRGLGDAPFDNLGLPYHRSFEADVAELPDAPVELVFDLHPTSNIFNAGHRVRITITGADADNNLTPRLSPAPAVRVHRNRRHGSFITLPIIPVTDRPASGS